MSVPNQISDGDWSLLIPMEGGSLEFPFSDKGDNVTWKQTLKYRMNRESYQPRATMSVVPGLLGDGYLTKLGTLRDVGCNIVEFEDTISAVPATRVEPGSFAYTVQWWRATAGSGVDPSKYFYSVNYDIEEQTFTVAANYLYEYFINTQPQPLIKPRVFLLFGFLQTIGGTPAINSNIVAEDSQVTIYDGKIYERRTPFVKINTPSAV